MGSKPSNAWQQTRGEAQTTDYKNFERGEKIKAEQKAEVAASEKGNMPADEHVRHAEGMIPQSGENPALAELKARKAARAESEDQEERERRAGERPDDERDR